MTVSFKICPKCQQRTSVHLAICPHCGQPFGATGGHFVAYPTASPTTNATPLYSHTQRAGAVGFLSGIVVAIIFLVIGGLLCMTGVGAIFGTFLMIGGLFALIYGPFFKVTFMTGCCPYCGYELRAAEKTPGLNCPACKQRVLVKGNFFTKLP